jgi:sugar lactone lactonase YvrE
MAVDRRGALYVTDTEIHRVLRYDHPQKNGQAADLVLGQPSFSSSTPHCSFFGGVSAVGFCSPRGVAVDRQLNLYVADALNARVLRYSRPHANGQAADLVLGQPDFTTGIACGFSTPRVVSAHSLCSPSGVAVDRRGDLLVTDALDNRVLRYNRSAPEEDDDGGED